MVSEKCVLGGVITQFDCDIHAVLNHYHGRVVPPPTDCARLNADINQGRPRQIRECPALFPPASLSATAVDVHSLSAC